MKWQWKIRKGISFFLVVCLFLPVGVPFSPAVDKNEHLSPVSPLDTMLLQGFLDADLTEIVESTKGLIFSEQAEEVDQIYSAYSKRINVPYLRVVIREPEDLSALRLAISLKEGKLKADESPLFKLIYETGGILLLDYANSDPKLVEEFNSLFDEIPRFEGRSVSEDLKIIGVMNRQFFSRYPVSFYSRYGKIISKAFSETDPIDQIKAPPKDYKGDQINLHYSSQFLEKLVGKYYFDSEGAFKFGATSVDKEGEVISQTEGLLVQAIREGKPLLIENGLFSEDVSFSLNQLKFEHFLRQIFVQGGLLVNGEFVAIKSGFKLYKQSVDEKDNTTEGTRVVPNNEAAAIIVNLETADHLFLISRISEETELMTQHSGWLSRTGEPVILRVVEPLPEEVWHQIFHAPVPVEVQVSNPKWIPVPYQSLIEEGFESTQEPRLPLSWDQAFDKKGFYIQGQDLALIREFIQAEVEAEVVVYTVTPETTLSELTSRTLVKPSKHTVGHAFFLKRPDQGILQALEEGKTVVLEGVDRNPALLKQFHSLLSDDPYWFVNGKRFGDTLPNGSKFKGRFILTANEPLSSSVWSANNVVFETDESDELTQTLLNKALFHSESALAESELRPYLNIILEKLFSLRDNFQLFAGSEEDRVIPVQFELHYEKLIQLFYYSHLRQVDLVEAFDKVFLSSYRQQPEIYSYMKVRLKKELGPFLNEHNLLKKRQKDKTLDGNKILVLKERGLTPQEMRQHFWQWADTISFDQLERLELPQFELDSKNTRSILNKIQLALIADSEEDSKEMLGSLYGQLSKQFSDWTVDYETAPLVPSWEEQKEEAAFIVDHFGLVFFKGPPGVGKSYISYEMAKKLGFKKTDIFELVTGADAQESDVLIQHRYDKEKKQSEENPRIIKEWAKNGGILVWDEANLLPKDFLQILSGLTAKEPFIWIGGEKISLTKRHIVIFTGNPESYEGRRFQELIEGKVLTINFNPFSDSDLKKLIQTNEYFSESIPNKSELIDFVIELHLFFEHVQPQLGFSLRDIQELSTRIRILGNYPQWTKENVALAAWELYSGQFDLEDQEAIKALIYNRYGVDIYSLLKDKQKQTEVFVAEHEEIFRGIGWAERSFQMVEKIRNFVAVRGARKESGDKKRYLGKWAFLMEGPSGLGKDDLLERTLRAEGLSFKKDYLVWNASPHKIEELKNLIQLAAREGKILVLSEMNLVSSSILEGILNTLLTIQGEFKPGFSVMGTINSINFQGREAFSSAFKNRMVYNRIYGHSQEGLTQIVNSFFDPAKRSTFQQSIQTFIGAHTWIRDHVAGPHQHPTLRELIRSAKRIEKGEALEKIILEEYGPIYLNEILRETSLPPLSQLFEYKEIDPIDWQRAYQKGAEVLIGPEKAERLIFVQSFRKGNLLPEKLVDSTIVTGEKGSEKTWKNLIYSVGRHLFHYPYSKWVPGEPLDELFNRLEHYRILNSLKNSGMINDFDLYNQEAKLYEAIINEDLKEIEGMDDKNLFTTLSILVALDKIEVNSYGWLLIKEVLEKEELLLKVEKSLKTVRMFLGSTVDQGFSVLPEQSLKRQFAAFNLIHKLDSFWKTFFPKEEKVVEDQKEGSSVEIAPVEAVLESSDYPSESVRPDGSIPQVDEAESEENAAVWEEIERQKELRRKEKIKEVEAKLAELEILFNSPFYEIKDSVSKACQSQLDRLKESAESLGLGKEEQIDLLRKRLNSIIYFNELNREIEETADKVYYKRNKEAIITIIVDVAYSDNGLMDRVKKISEDKYPEERTYLLDKTKLLLEKLRRLQEMEKIIERTKKDFNDQEVELTNDAEPESLAKMPLIEKPKTFAELFFGDGFFQVVDTGTSLGGGMNIPYSGDYLENEAEGGTLNERTRTIMQYFSPALYSHVRLEVRSEVVYSSSGIGIQERKDVKLEPFSVKRSWLKEEIEQERSQWEEKGYEVYQAAIPISLKRGQLLRIPSVAPEQHLFGVDVPEGITFWKDSEDQYYIRSDQSSQEKVVLKFNVAAPKAYFNMSIPETLDLKDKKDPAVIHKDVLTVLNYLKLDPNERNINKILNRLIEHISQFSEEPIPKDKRTGNVFVDSVINSVGVCRQRTWAFVIIAEALGLEVRSVWNRDADGRGLHTFPEVRIPSQGTFQGGWRRIHELGGASSDLHEEPRYNSESRPIVASEIVLKSRSRKKVQSPKKGYILQETSLRRPFLKQMSLERSLFLSDLLKRLYYPTLSQGLKRRASSDRGSFKMSRFMEDPSRPLESIVQPVVNRPKELILSGPFQAWNPLLEEVIYYLFDQGFKINIYESDLTEPYVVKTLGELKTRLEQAPEIDLKEIEQYIRREKNSFTCTYVDLNRIKAQTESLYMEELFVHLIEGKRFLPSDGREMTELKQLLRNKLTAIKDNRRSGQSELKALVDLKLPVDDIKEILKEEIFSGESLNRVFALEELLKLSMDINELEEILLSFLNNYEKNEDLISLILRKGSEFGVSVNVMKPILIRRFNLDSEWSIRREAFNGLIDLGLSVDELNRIKETVAIVGRDSELFKKGLERSLNFYLLSGEELKKELFDQILRSGTSKRKDAIKKLVDLNLAAEEFRKVFLPIIQDRGKDPYLRIDLIEAYITLKLPLEEIKEVILEWLGSEDIYSSDMLEVLMKGVIQLKVSPEEYRPIVAFNSRNHYSYDRTLLLKAIEELGIKDSSYKPILLEVINNKDMKIAVRVEAVKAFVHLDLDLDEVKEELIAKSDDKFQDVELRVAALQGLTQLNLEQSELKEILLSRLRNVTKSSNIRVAALRGLTKIGLSNSEMLQIIFSSLERKVHWEVKEVAIEILATENFSEKERVIQKLEEILGQSYQRVEVHIEALKGLVLLSLNQEKLEKLSLKLIRGDFNWELKKIAIEELVRQNIESPEFIDLLVAIAENEREWHQFRHTAVKGLAELNSLSKEVWRRYLLTYQESRVETYQDLVLVATSASSVPDEKEETIDSEEELLVLPEHRFVAKVVETLVQPQAALSLVFASFDTEEKQKALNKVLKVMIENQLFTRESLLLLVEIQNQLKRSGLKEELEKSIAVNSEIFNVAI